MRVIFFFVFMLPLCLLGNSFVDATQIAKKYDNFQISYHIDSTNSLTYKDMQQKEFTQSINNRFTLGFLNDPVWFKLNIHNPKKHPLKIVFALHEVFYDEVSLYYQKNGKTVHQKSGLQVDMNKREINNPNAHFYVDLGPRETTTLYVKAKPLFATFGQFFLYDLEYYRNHAYKEGFLYTFYLGAVLAISFYNLFLYFYLRSRPYLYYFGYSLSFGIWTGGLFGGMAFYYIPIQYDYNLHFVTPLAILFLMLFSNEVLEVKKNHPKIYKLLQIHHWLLAIAAFLILFYDALPISFKVGFEFTNLVAGYIFFFYIYFALKQIGLKNKVATIYLIAIGTFLVSITVLSLMTMGVFPNTIFTRYGFLVGAFLEIILLSLLLAYRIDILQKDYQKTLQKEIERQTRNLYDKNRALSCIVSEKEELLREMFHRVKNNFQTLVSMLYLEISDEKSKIVTEKIESTIKKVHSMAVVHGMLYEKSENLDIKTKAFFENLTKHLITKDAKISLDIEDFYLPDTIVKNLGLVINELYINTVKHAPYEHNLRLRIKITKKTDRVFFEYEDNSLGYSATKSGYGTEFIKETLQKLEDVRLQIDTNKKIYYKIDFKV